MQREMLSARLAQAEKMESVGRLAGGVAHDFNNMLNVIFGHTEIAMGKIGPEHPVHGALEEIRKATVRSADLTRQLLAFARRQTVAPVALNLNDSVRGILAMLRRMIREEVRLDWKPDPGLWRVRMDPSQVDQMLVNLCLNARDAIMGVGTIWITTENRTLDEASCAELPGSSPGDYAVLAVSDDGCGMDGQTLVHIFEPFFTTKRVGEGTGLGLATVYGVVKQNGGFIDVRSRPGQGATFRIYLPHYAGAVEQLRQEAPAEPLRPGHETILVVEDEEAVLKLTQEMLEEQGYAVLAASAPGGAIRLAAHHAGRIDLLITDVVMPEMNGRELADNLRTQHPSLRVLYMSGYTADIIADHSVLNQGISFIQKPFSSKGLVEKIRQTLEE
jgi:two-component system cell cycle sensor histidine kinase/response regulator CckA